ncbi:retrovirus-related pol polyprotein from transposon TNT 1-94 [Tanacetum coccineum]
MDVAVQQFSVDKQCLEIAKKELFLENDRLLQKIMSRDVLLTVMNSMSLIGESVNMDGKRKESCNLEVFKEQFDSIKKVRVRTKEQSDSLIEKLNLKSAKNEDLKAQLQDKVFVTTSLKNDLRKIKEKEIVDIAAQIPSTYTIVPVMFKLDLEPLAPRLSDITDIGLWIFRKHMIGNRSQLMNFVSKFLGTVRFGNDNIARIIGLGKSKKSSHQPKAEDTNQEKLYLLHMDLCGPMRVASINGKRYILVIVDDYSRFTWVRFLRTKDEAPEAIIKCIKNIQVRLNATVRNVRTDNGTEFVNQTLREFYENVGISHQTSVARTPQQNGVVERRNRTLVEAARTMLIFSKAPLFLWAEAINTACYTQNRSIIRRRYNKTPYELMQDKKPDLSFFHVFGALCYPTNDNDDLGKLDAKADIVITEYLVNISKRRAFWSLNEDILKITILKTNTPYPSRKIRRIRACTHQRPQRKEDQYAVSRRSQYAVLKIMDDPNITMEEYIRLEEEKAQKHGKVFNWETAKYGKIWYDEDIHYLRSVETKFPAIAFIDKVSSKKTHSCEPTVSSLNDEIDFRVSFDDFEDEDYTPIVSCFDDLDFKDFENEFPAIVYNNAQTSKSDLLTEPILSPQLINEFDLNDEISLSEYDKEEHNVLYFNDLFPFNIIHLDDLKSEKDNDDNEIDIVQSSGDIALPPRDQRHQYLRREVHRVQVFDFGGLSDLMAEGLSAKMLMKYRDAQGDYTLIGFDAYWAESARQIPDNKDLRDYWIRNLSAGDFLGTSPSYTAIRDSILRMCHRFIARRSQAPKKVTMTDLFYLRGMDVNSVNVPYLLARYVRLFSTVRKSGDHISGGQFVALLAEHFGLLIAEILGGLIIYEQFDDTWDWVAMGPERRHDTATGAPGVAQDALVIDEGGQADPAPVQAPPPLPPPPLPPPAAARTMPQRMARLKEDVHKIHGALTE